MRRSCRLSAPGHQLRQKDERRGASLNHSSLIICNLITLGAREASERVVAGYLKLEAFERGDARRVVREKQYAAQAQLVQNLRADPVVATFAVASLDACLILRQTLLLHNLVGAQLVNEVEVVLPLAQVQDDAAPFGRDALKRGVELKARVVYE